MIICYDLNEKTYTADVQLDVNVLTILTDLVGGGEIRDIRTVDAAYFDSEDRAVWNLLCAYTLDKTDLLADLILEGELKKAILKLLTREEGIDCQKAYINYIKV